MYSAVARVLSHQGTVGGVKLYIIPMWAQAYRLHLREKAKRVLYTSLWQRSSVFRIYGNALALHAPLRSVAVYIID